MKKIATFDDWIDAFRAWQKDIGLELPWPGRYEFVLSIDGMPVRCVPFRAGQAPD